MGSVFCWTEINEKQNNHIFYKCMLKLSGMCVMYDTVIHRHIFIGRTCVLGIKTVSPWLPVGELILLCNTCI